LFAVENIQKFIVRVFSLVRPRTRSAESVSIILITAG